MVRSKWVSVCVMVWGMAPESRMALASKTALSALDGWIDICRTGTWRDMHGQEITIDEARLERLATHYQDSDPAPVVVGHPETDSPAYGWVASLRRVGDRLQARLRDIDAAFRAAVEAGRYAGRSVSLDTNAKDPGTGENIDRLLHLGFLGGRAPAVPGLAPTRFAGHPRMGNKGKTHIITLTAADLTGSNKEKTHLGDPQGGHPRMGNKEKTHLGDPQGGHPRMGNKEKTHLGDPQGGHPRMGNKEKTIQPAENSPFEKEKESMPKSKTNPNPIPDAGLPVTGANPEDTSAKDTSAEDTSPDAQDSNNPALASPALASETVAERVALATERKELAAERARLEAERVAIEHDRRLAVANQLLDGHVKAGRILPAERPQLAALLASLPTPKDANGSSTCVFAAADGTKLSSSPRAILEAFLSGLPTRIDYGEWAGPDTTPTDHSNDHTVAEKAQALMATDPTGNLTIDRAVRRTLAETGGQSDA